MQFSHLNEVEISKDDAESAHKNLLNAIDMQSTFIEITQLVVSETCETYLSATALWLEERSIPFNLINKYIPASIIEKIRDEAVDERLLRPSTKIIDHNSFDFLYE